jgi:hypothetical protein
LRFGTPVLIALALLTRLPFFFRAVINWDESTFIVMGEALVRGHLPYLSYWDLKPPLLFAVFAGAIAVLGLSVEAIRLAGAICVISTALAVRALGRRSLSPASGILAAAMFIVSITALQGGQATLSELVAIVPLLFGLLILTTPALSTRRLFFAGALLGVASLVRLNLVLVPLVVASWILFSRRPRSLTRAPRQLLAFTSGGFTVLAAAFLPYLLTGTPGSFYTAVFLAPLSYASDHRDMLGAAGKLLRSAFGDTRVVDSNAAAAAVGIAVWLAGAVGVILIAHRRRRMSGTNPRNVLVGLGGAAVLVSILTGPAHPHYLIQLLPFACLPAADLWSGPLSRLARGVPVKAALLAAAAVCLWPVLGEYRLIGRRLAEALPLAHGKEHQLAAYLESHCGSPCSVYLPTDQLVYALLRSPPPTPIVTHPSNLAKDRLVALLHGPSATPGSVMSGILSERPRFVVRPTIIGYLEGTPAGELLERSIATDYELVHSIDDRLIYRRLPRSRPD